MSIRKRILYFNMVVTGVDLEGSESMSHIEPIVKPRSASPNNPVNEQRWPNMDVNITCLNLTKYSLFPVTLKFENIRPGINIYIPIKNDMR